MRLVGLLPVHPRAAARPLKAWTLLRQNDRGHERHSVEAPMYPARDETPTTPDRSLRRS